MIGGSTWDSGTKTGQGVKLYRKWGAIVRLPKQGASARQELAGTSRFLGWTKGGGGGAQY